MRHLHLQKHISMKTKTQLKILATKYYSFYRWFFLCKQTTPHRKCSDLIPAVCTLGVGLNNPDRALTKFIVIHSWRDILLSCHGNQTVYFYPIQGSHHTPHDCTHRHWQSFAIHVSKLLHFLDLYYKIFITVQVSKCNHFCL